MWGDLRDPEELERFHVNMRGCRDLKPAEKAEGSYGKAKCFSFPCADGIPWGIAISSDIRCRGKPWHRCKAGVGAHPCNLPLSHFLA